LNTRYSIGTIICRGITICLVTGLFVSACGIRTPSPPASESDQDPGFEPALVVSGTGVVLPELYASLSLQAAGEIAEVLVEEGDIVQAGQPLVRLVGGNPENPPPEIQAVVRASELEVHAAQLAFDNLEKQVEALSLQAQQAYIKAAGEIRDLQYQMEALEVPDSQASLDPIEAYEIALETYQEAEEAYRPYRSESDNDIRRELKEKLDQAREEYDTAVSRLQLSLSLDAAEANRDRTKTDWEKYKNGPPDEDYRQAVMRLESAKASLDAAKGALEKLTLLSPFSGTICEVNVRAGEYVMPGFPAVVVADLSQLYISTTDINEMDIVQIVPGDPVEISFDALPELVVPGRVTTIANKASPGVGVNYRVLISMESAPAELRWGMIAFVDILPRK
jgi:HlyD family secretion protein